jgi:hypothetical protein
MAHVILSERAAEMGRVANQSTGVRSEGSLDGDAEEGAELRLSMTNPKGMETRRMHH